VRYFAVAVQTNEELFVTTLMDQLDAMMDTTSASVKDDLIIENFSKKPYPIWGNFDKMTEHAGKNKNRCESNNLI
jgi:hypothetical protein